MQNDSAIKAVEEIRQGLATACMYLAAFDAGIRLDFERRGLKELIVNGDHAPDNAVISELVHKAFIRLDALALSESGWADISTAPRDGTEIMAIRWLKDHWWYMQISWKYDGWIFSNDGDSGCADPEFWQHIPPPPPPQPQPKAPENEGEGNV